MDGHKSSRLCRRLFSVGIKLVSEINGYLIADFRMTPDTIVEHLDVFKGHLPGLLTGGKAIVMQAFRFERAKEALHRRIVPAVSLPTHLCLHAIADL